MNKNFFVWIFILVLSFSLVSAQTFLFEDFEDGDFSNPTWTVSSDLTITSNGFMGGGKEAYIDGTGYNYIPFNNSGTGFYNLTFTVRSPDIANDRVWYQAYTGGGVTLTNGAMCAVGSGGAINCCNGTACSDFHEIASGLSSDTNYVLSYILNGTSGDWEVLLDGVSKGIFPIRGTNSGGYLGFSLIPDSASNNNFIDDILVQNGTFTPPVVPPNGSSVTFGAVSPVEGSITNLSLVDFSVDVNFSSNSVNNCSLFVDSVISNESQFVFPVSAWALTDDFNDYYSTNNGTPTNMPTVGLYPFEENALDSSAYGNDGVVSGGVSNTTGVYGGAYAYDGSTGKVSIPSYTFDLTSSQGTTIEFWAKMDELGDDNAILGIPTSSVISYLYIRADGYLYSETNTNNDKLFGLLNDYDTDWHYYSISCVSGTCILTQDAVDITVDGSVTDDLTSSLIGHISAGVSVMNGTLDEFRITEDYLDLAQISYNYNQTVLGVRGAVEPVNDVSDLDKVGTVFDGVDDRVVLGTNTGVESNSYSLTGWIKPTSSADDKIVYCYADLSAGRTGYCMGVKQSDDGSIPDKFYFEASADGLPERVSGTVVDYGEWQHVAVTVDNGYTVVFQNGVPTGSGYINNATFTGDNFERIGSIERSSDNLNVAFMLGSIYDLRTYNNTLSFEQVNVSYLDGLDTLNLSKQLDFSNLLVDGSHNYKFSCVNDLETVNTTLTSFSVASLDVAINPSPQDLSVFNTDSVTLSTNVNSTNPTNCSLYLNSVLNDTISIPNGNILVNFSKSFSDGVYNFSIQCNDSIGNSEQSNTKSFEVVTQEVVFSAFDRVSEFQLTNWSIQGSEPLNSSSFTLSTTNGTISKFLRDGSYVWNFSNEEGYYNQSFAFTVSGNSVINVSNVHNSRLSVTAFDLFDGSFVNDFSVSFVSNGFNESISTSSGTVVHNGSLGNYSLVIDADGFSFARANVSLENFSQSYQFDLFTLNSVVLEFLYQHDRSLVSENISLEFISDDFAKTYNVSNGRINVTNISAGEYELRYSFADSQLEQSFFTLIDREHNDFSLYMLDINDSVDVKALTLHTTDFSGLSVENAIISILRGYIVDEQYQFLQVGSVKTNVNGEANHYFELDTAPYKFSIEFEDEIVFTSSSSMFISESDEDLFFTLNLYGVDYLERYEAVDGVSYSLTFVNTSDTSGYFRYEFTSVDKLVKGCLKVDMFQGASSSELSDYCSSSFGYSGLLTYSVNHSSSVPASFFGVATLFLQGDDFEYAIDTVSKRFGQPSVDFGWIGYIFAFILVLGGFFVGLNIAGLKGALLSEGVVWLLIAFVGLANIGFSVAIAVVCLIVGVVMIMGDKK